MPGNAQSLTINPQAPQECHRAHLGSIFILLPEVVILVESGPLSRSQMGKSVLSNCVRKRSNWYCFWACQRDSGLRWPVLSFGLPLLTLGRALRVDKMRKSMTETLTRLAAEQQRRFDAGTLPRTRKERGHFGTAPAIADYMAGMFAEIPKGPVRVLDPGAGVGTLSAAICQRVLEQKNSRHLIFELWENDPDLAPCLCATMEACKKALKDAGHEMQFTILFGDFVLDYAKPSLFEAASDSHFDLVIMNPPYFKVRKESKHARAMAHVVYGQPNIYAFFMAVASGLLRDGGEMVAITPRSYFSGPYFKRFRKWFFDRMTARQIHVFESRTDAFREDEVLQENVILLAEKSGKPRDVVLISSPGRNFQRVDRHVLPYRRVIENSTGDHLVRVAMNTFSGVTGRSPRTGDRPQRRPHRELIVPSDLRKVMRERLVRYSLILILLGEMAPRRNESYDVVHPRTKLKYPTESHGEESAAPAGFQRR